MNHINTRQNRAFRSLLIGVLWTLCGSTPAMAVLPGQSSIAVDTAPQDRSLRLMATTTDSRAYVLLLEIPPGMQGFNIYRTGPGDAAPVLLTPSPIVAVADPARARAMLGDDFPWIARALRVQDAFEVLSRVRTDPGAAAAISLASLQAAAVAGRLFVDSDVERDRSYEYRVDALDLDGNVIAAGERTLRIRDSRPESSPGGLTAEAGDGNIRIAWDYPDYSGDPDDAVVGFHVYRSVAGGPFERIQKPPVLRQDDLTYRIDAGVENNTDYSYYVTAVDFVGRESEPSEVVSGTPIDLTPPSFPREVEVFPEEDALLVTWRMNLELDMSHYDVYRSLELDTGYEKINAEPIPGDQPRYLDDGLRSGALYHYMVKALDGVGNESEFSNAASGRPNDATAPATPDSLTATVEGHTVTLSWRAPPDPDLEGYYVYRKRDEQDFLPVRGAVLPVDTLSIVDAGYDARGLRPGKTYTYAVTALDHAFNESEQAVVDVAIPDDEPPTPPVESYAHSNAEGLVELQWQPSLALDVVAYRIYRAEEGRDVESVMTLGRDVFETVDSTAERGRPYSYYVVAVDAGGNESVGTEPTVVTPRDLTVPPPPMSVRAVSDAEGVLLSWEPVQAPDLVGYVVYRSDGPYGAALQLTALPVVETQFRDPDGAPGQYYRVSSVDTSGHENKAGEAIEARAAIGSF